MAKFIIDTDLMVDSIKHYTDNKERELYILNTLRAAHKGVVTAPWLTPYPVKKKRMMDGTGEYSKAFNVFHDTYPTRNGKKSGKRPAFKAWCKHITEEMPETKLLHLCCMALEWQTQQEDWTKENGKFIPMHSTWLGAEGWTDEKPTGKKKGNKIAKSY